MKKIIFAKRERQRLFLFAILVVTLSGIKAQNHIFNSHLILDTLPLFSFLQNSIQSHFNQKFQADSILFVENKKGEWKKYIPNVGFGFALIEKGGNIESKIRPSLNFGTSTIFQIAENRRNRKLELQSLKLKNRINYLDHVRKVKSKYDQYFLRKEELEKFKELVFIDRQLFAISKDKFERTKLDSEAFLKAKKTMLKIEFEMRKKELEIEAEKAEILKESKVL